MSDESENAKRVEEEEAQTGEGAGDIADRLRFARNMRNLSQREFAKLAGVSSGTTALWEGQRYPRADLLARAAQVLDVDLWWLITGEGHYDTKWAPRLAGYPLETLMEAISLRGFEVTVTAPALQGGPSETDAL